MASDSHGSEKSVLTRDIRVTSHRENQQILERRRKPRVLEESREQQAKSAVTR